MVEADSQGALSAVRCQRGVPYDLLKITKHSRLRHISGIGLELEPRKPERLNLEYGGTVTHLTESGRLTLPPYGGMHGDCDHGQVSPIVTLGIGPPGFGLHIHFGVLAKVQPHMHNRGSG